MHSGSRLLLFLAAASIHSCNVSPRLIPTTETAILDEFVFNCTSMYRDLDSMLLDFFGYCHAFIPRDTGAIGNPPLGASRYSGIDLGPACILVLLPNV